MADNRETPRRERNLDAGGVGLEGMMASKQVMEREMRKKDSKPLNMAPTITLDDISMYISDQPLRGITDTLTLVALDLSRRNVVDDRRYHALRTAIVHINTAVNWLREA